MAASKKRRHAKLSKPTKEEEEDTTTTTTKTTTTVKDNDSSKEMKKEKEKTPEKTKKRKSKELTVPSSEGEKEEDKNNDDKPETWSKSKKKRMRMLKAKQKKKEDGDSPNLSSTSPKKKKDGGNDNDTEAPTSVDENPSQQQKEEKPKKSSLQDAFKARLTGSRFRILNEELYTTTSTESFERFSTNPELFEQYHEGFRHQVESWPVNPVDVIVRWILSYAHNKHNNNNNNTNQNKKAKNNDKKKNTPCVVADFGCGDAQLAKDLLEKQGKSNQFTVHSFDLVSKNELVTACDMANVPLPDKSVDIAVFCLSLMGTNLADFIREAHRVLKDDGRVKIAEVRSRIEYSHSQKNKQKQTDASSTQQKDNNKSAGTLDEFVGVLNQLGFECIKKDVSNKMFLVLELKKSGKAPNKKLEFSAKPCIYKRR